MISVALVGVGIVVAVFGAFVLVRWPHIKGESKFRLPIPGLPEPVEVSSTNAGVLFFLVGVAIVVGALLVHPLPKPAPVPGPNMLGSMAPVGTAQRLNGEHVRLTGTKGLEAGAVWTHNQFDVSRPFAVDLEFRITPSNDKGSDGLAFVVQNSEPRPRGSEGGGMGYQGIPRSVAVEFDTWHNLVDRKVTVADPSNNHVGIHSRGPEPNSADQRFALVTTSDIPFLADSEKHTARIRYNGRELRVCVDDHKSCLVHAVDIPSLIGSTTAWVGVTAGSGPQDVAEIHDLLRFYFDANP